MNSKISIVKCPSYEAGLVRKSVAEAVELLGGIASIIKPSSKVLVKPNLLMAKGPESGIITHPEVMRAVVRILKDNGCEVLVGDSPNFWIKNMDEAYEISGIRKVCEEEGAILVNFDKERWREKFPLTTWLDDCDYLVSVPKFKTHASSILTAALKNLYGLVNGAHKMDLHHKYTTREEFGNILADIYREARPALTIVDGIVAMEGNGPSTGGTLRTPGLILAGSDCVAMDSVLAIIMGLKPLDIINTKIASERGLGTSDMSRIDIMGCPLSQSIQKRPFKLPQSANKSRLPKIVIRANRKMIRLTKAFIKAVLPAPLAKIAKKSIQPYPEIDPVKCTQCGTCIQACPNKIISRKKGKVVIDYSKCIYCFCCLEACPNNAIKIKKNIWTVMMRL